MSQMNECCSPFATPLNTTGMGNVTMPTDGEVGSGDMVVMKPKKKKMMSLKDYILKNKNHQIKKKQQIKEEVESLSFGEQRTLTNALQIDNPNSTFNVWGHDKFDDFNAKDYLNQCKSGERTLSAFMDFCTELLNDINISVETIKDFLNKLEF